MRLQCAAPSETASAGTLCAFSGKSSCPCVGEEEAAQTTKAIFTEIVPCIPKVLSVHPHQCACMIVPLVDTAAFREACHCFVCLNWRMHVLCCLH